MYNILDIAMYVINYGVFINKPITNLQLQKVIYYIEKQYSEIFGESLFNEDYKVTEYGVIYSTLYNEFSEYSHRPIPKQEYIVDVIFNSEICKLEVIKKSVSDIEIEEKIKSIISSVYNELINIDIWDLVKKNLNDIEKHTQNLV